MRDRASSSRISARKALLLPMVVWLAVVQTLAGCGSIPYGPPTIEAHPLDQPGAPQAIAVMASPDMPVTRLQAFARGGTEGASKGALAGAAAGAYTTLLIVGPWIVFLPAVLAGGTVIGLAAGAAAGAGVAVPEEDAAAIERLAVATISPLQLPERTSQIVAGRLRKLAGVDAAVVDRIEPSNVEALRVLRGRGYGAAIDLKLKEIGFDASGVDTIMTLFMTAEARLVDTASGKPVAMRGLVYVSPEHGYGRWTENEAALTKAEIERAYSTLGERIVEGLVLGVDWGMERLDPLVPICGLVPRRPSPEWTGGFASPKRLVEPQVESVTPLLAWSPLPATDADATDDRKDWSVNWKPMGAQATPTPPRKAPWADAKAGDVTYDLRIWSVADGAPDALVYERERLPEPQHRLDTALEPGSTYFWSVRMRYIVDGRVRTTRWSAANTPQSVANLKPALREALFHSRLDNGTLKPASCSVCGCLDFIPAANHFRFRTP